mgnify:CR=1 FL=1
MKLKIINTHKLKNEPIDEVWSVYDVIENEDEYCFVCWNGAKHMMANIFLGRNDFGHETYAFNERNGLKKALTKSYPISSFTTPKDMLERLEFELCKPVK